MLYDLIKVVHVTGWVMWIGGLVFLLAALADRAPAQALSRTARRITGTGIALAWLAGAMLAWLGGWYLDGWFLAKFAIAFGLGGLHGMIIGRLRRGAPVPARALYYTHLAAVVAVIWLALVKPF